MKNEFDEMPTENYKKYEETARQLDVHALVDFTCAITKATLDKNIPLEELDTLKSHFNEIEDFKMDLIIRSIDKANFPAVAFCWLLEDVTKILPYIENEELKKELINGQNIFQSFINRFLTRKKCPDYGTLLLLSDLPQYNYVCYECDGNYDYGV